MRRIKCQSILMHGKNTMKVFRIIAGENLLQHLPKRILLVAFGQFNIWSMV